MLRPGMERVVAVQSAPARRSVTSIAFTAIAAVVLVAVAMRTVSTNARRRR